jgi:hypothetical protein
MLQSHFAIGTPGPATESRPASWASFGAGRARSIGLGFRGSGWSWADDPPSGRSVPVPGMVESAGWSADPNTRLIASNGRALRVRGIRTVLPVVRAVKRAS